MLRSKDLEVIFQLRERQLRKLFFSRLGERAKPYEVTAAVSLALEHRSVADFTSETLGLQVGLTWTEKDSLNLTHIACIDRSREWLKETKAARRRKKDAARKRRKRAQSAKPPSLSPRARAVISAVTETTSMSALIRKFDEHEAFVDPDGVFLAPAAMRVAMSRTLTELSRAGLLASQTRPTDRGLLERLVSPVPDVRTQFGYA